MSMVVMVKATFTPVVSMGRAPFTQVRAIAGRTG
jgi:hypothetical protein